MTKLALLVVLLTVANLSSAFFFYRGNSSTLKASQFVQIKALSNWHPEYLYTCIFHNNWFIFGTKSVLVFGKHINFLLDTGNSGLGNYNRGLSSWLLRGLGGGFGGSEAGDAGDILEQQQANQRRFNSFGGGRSFGNFWGGSGGYTSPYFLNPYGDY